MTSRLRQRLEQDFHSLDNLKAEFLAHACGMFGPGFVWLVMDDAVGPNNYRQFKIMRTYGSGSALRDTHFMDRFQKQDVEGLGGQGTKAYEEASKLAPTARSTVRPSPGTSFNPGAAFALQRTNSLRPLLSVKPCLAVSVFQHSYLTDYGVGGKEAYLQAWWELINWSRVADLSLITASEQVTDRIIKEEATERPWMRRALVN
jgi:Fe-Mn family superoxide dismutase